MESPHKDNKPDMCMCMASMFTVWYQYKNIFKQVIPKLETNRSDVHGSDESETILKACENDTLVSFAILLTAVSLCRFDTASVLYADARSPLRLIPETWQLPGT